MLGIAEETGGSIQNPAAAQALVGIKPTFGLVPNAGVVPLAGSTRDVVGPHARTVHDAAVMLDVIAGYTAEDAKTVASIGNIPKRLHLQAESVDPQEQTHRSLWSGVAWRRTDGGNPKAI